MDKHIHKLGLLFNGNSRFSYAIKMGPFKWRNQNASDITES